MRSLLMGAVAYDPKVVTIWDGFRAWFRDRGFDFDYVLYSHYERQVDDLVAGRIHAAWNSPLAWVRTARCAPGARPLIMRDSDQDLTSVVVVRADSDFVSVRDLAGRTVAVGAVDSPQATLIPLSRLRGAGASRVEVRRFDVGVGLHGDHIGGERDAARALAAGEVDAACMIDANHLSFVREGTLAPGSTRVVAQTSPYDHCNMTVIEGRDDGAAVERFGELLLSMSYADPRVRPLLDLEGLTEWRPGRTTGYAALEAAVDETGFYDAQGNVTAADYRP
ncbi:MAG TPA: PhnD/SsuA/transferrin family substrate-binding protein [Acidimicrobiales bacterium]|nr:PhnD/SsuA/transferrin family substrate-binding protein [Acidimicrobiales bacterium]